MSEVACFKDLVRDDLVNASSASNLAFNEKVKQMIRGGRKVYHFAFGQSPFPVPACLQSCVQHFLHVHDYLPMSGISELREELVKFHERHDGVRLGRDNLVVGPGSKELIFLTITTFSGEVLLPSPCWTTYAPQCALAGKKARLVQTRAAQGWKVTPEALREATAGSRAKQLFILTNPGNPTGTCYTEEELAALSRVCRELGVVVLSDEIYARLAFSAHATMVKHYPEGTILTSGISKWASAGGWRLGYAHFPSALGSLLQAVTNAASQTYSCAPAPMQYGLAKALKEHGPELDQYSAGCRRILRSLAHYCHRELSQVGVTGPRGEAGYYFMPDFEVIRRGLAERGLTTGAHMVQAMLDESAVALMSSQPFLRPAEELTTRFCFVCFDGSLALAALEEGEEEGDDDLPDDFLRRHCLPVVEGVQSLKQWVLRHHVSDT